MPRILNGAIQYRKRYKKKAAFAGAVILIVISIAEILIDHYFLAALCFAALIFGAVNIAVWMKSRDGIQYFSPSSKVRNIDCLLIGDMCCPDDIIPENKSYIYISAPGRSLKSSFEILRHTFSILKEDGGEAVIAIQKGNMEKDISLFDIPFFELSPVSIKRLHLEGLKRKKVLPLLFAPVKSLQILLGKKYKSIREIRLVPPEIEDFCKERNISLRIIHLE